MCRAPIPLSLCEPPVNAPLWEELQRRYPGLVRKRAREEALKEAQKAREGESSAATLQRDRLQALMESHRGLLEAACPDYFGKLPQELQRPLQEILRCTCALPSSGEGSHGLGYIMLRRTARSGRNAGRTYAACPLGKPGDQHAGAAGSVAAAAGCNRWRWDV